jgi:hypothetical protein
MKFKWYFYGIICLSYLIILLKIFLTGIFISAFITEWIATISAVIAIYAGIGIAMWLCHQLMFGKLHYWIRDIMEADISWNKKDQKD